MSFDVLRLVSRLLSVPPPDPGARIRFPHCPPFTDAGPHTTAAHREPRNEPELVEALYDCLERLRAR